MDEFTFVTLTYNHEKYILEHLESIKYQIINHAKDIKCSLLICDDCSTDGTISLCKKWLKKNDTLFYNANIICSDTNNGTVKNIVSALHRVHTNSFKILAGDDLYYKENIFELFCNSNNFVITPAIKIKDNSIIDKEWRDYYNHYINNTIIPLRRKIKKDISNTMPFETPAIFWKKNLFDYDVEKYIKQYTLIEDVPLFYYFLNNKIINAEFIYKPYIIYRVSSGMSTDKSHNKRSLYDIERKKIEKEIWHLDGAKQIINKRKNYIKCKIYQKIYLLFPTIKNANEDYKKELKNATEYYNLIRYNVSLFLDNK